MPPDRPVLYYRFTMNHGMAELVVPATLDPDEIDELDQWIALVLPTAKRIATTIKETPCSH